MEFIEEKISNINNISPDDIKELITLVQQQKINTKKLLILIDKLIDVNLESAKEILATITDSRFKTETFYLESIIKEKENYLSYDKETKENYDRLLALGCSFLTLELFDEAYYSFEAGLYLTKDNIFNYYIGKALNKSRRKDEAIPYFQKYIKRGGQKYSKALLFLSSHYNYYNIKSGEDYVKKIKQLSLFAINFSYIDSSSKNQNEFDYIKSRASKKIKMTPDDFKTEIEEDLAMEDYYSYDFLKKLRFIRKLLETNQIKIANKLLNELSPLTIEEKDLYQQFNKNKTLYRNKNPLV